MAETVLQEANRLVNGDRQKDYGHPLDDYTKTGAFWSIILKDKLKPGETISPQDCVLMMVCLKISREMNLPKRDNRVDGAGYFGALDLIYQEIQRRQQYDVAGREVLHGGGGGKGETSGPDTLSYSGSSPA
jgi:uncharacterized protein DUF6378